MNKTPDETKRGLECCQDFQSCTEYGEPKCPYNDIKECVDTLLADSLAYIRHLEAANIEVLNLCKQLERERDAAVAELKDNRICQKCEHFDAGWNEPCLHCDDENNCFEWRGVKEE